MANWDHFEILDSGKVAIKFVNGNIVNGLDMLKRPNGLYLFLNKEDMGKIKNYTPEELVKSSEYSIYSLVGDEVNGKKGITRRITSQKDLREIIQEIEGNKLV
ncbi:MAG TPA: hypothetical protein PK357_01690 [Candidatus Pacearchaeota archaeon]|nr:hypothetical protein [Candidatus Pacearchaeota archaeon]